MTVIIPILIVSGIFASCSLWLFFGLPGLIALTYSLSGFCHSLFVKCVNNVQAIMAGFFWLGSALILTGFIYASVRAISTLVRTHRAIKRLPLKHREKPLVLIDDAGLKTAFTHGFFRPRIYISKGLLRGLDAAELKGVFLHELHHKRRRDPLRFFLTAIATDFFFFIPAFKYLERRIRLKREHNADRAGADFMKEPVSLAHALLKVARYNSPMAPVSFNRDISMIEARIKGLIGGGKATLPLPGLKTIVTSIIIFSFFLLSLAAPLKAGALSIESCTKKHCSRHVEKATTSCRTHCKTSRRWSFHEEKPAGVEATPLDSKISTKLDKFS